MRTPKEVKAEIAKLVKMKPSVRRTSVFGDNHHDSIDAQVEVLENLLDGSDIYEKQDDGEWAQNVVDCAFEARYWFDGEEDDAPSEDWKSSLVD